MYHTIIFSGPFTVDLETSPSARLEQMIVGQGMRMKAQLRPYVIEAENGPVEVADLFFDDGTTARAVPFERFLFAD